MFSRIWSRARQVQPTLPLIVDFVPAGLARNACSRDPVTAPVMASSAFDFANRDDVAGLAVERSDVDHFTAVDGDDAVSDQLASGLTGRGDTPGDIRRCQDGSPSTGAGSHP